jgi:hypothetical protein
MLKVVHLRGGPEWLEPLECVAFTWEDTMRFQHTLFAATAAVFAVSLASAAEMSDEEIIASAEKAAPASVGKDATIIAMDEQMKARVVREGTNGFTCMPDNPQSPGTDPMCLDKGGLEWAKAWMAHENPPEGVIGLGYMLMGGSDASNTDPHAMGPAQGGNWVDTGPHVMLLNVGTMGESYPKQGDNPDTKAP